MQEKRRNKRLDLRVVVQLERLYSQGTTDTKYINVEVTDLSRSGIGFRTSQKLQVDTYYDTQIQIWTKEVIAAVIEIVRTNEDEDGIYHYGASFIGMTDADAIKIDIYNIFNET
ncbi:MAG: PilZ domain-containing protein [Lachnospiraceae bacterium]